MTSQVHEPMTLPRPTPAPEALSCQPLDVVAAAVSKADAAAGLMSRYLTKPEDFWFNVQEPSTRVKDPKQLALLALLSLTRFNGRHERAAATVSLLYRSVEKEWEGLISQDDLLALAQQVRTSLTANESFSDCRWYLSLVLGEAALHLFRGHLSAAAAVLRQADNVQGVAHGFGQLFTNIVKTTLLRLAIAASDSYRCTDKEELLSLADSVLKHSGDAPFHYRFTNEWAYEEVAYVYTMMREIYNWRRLSATAASLKDLETAGFRWRQVGSPFKQLIPL
jgi:hypothetical protein